MIRILLFMLIPSIVISQDVAVGQWKDYLAYNQASDICVAKERVYCVAQGGLFYYNNDDNSINRISKINGLSDNSIKQIKYNKENERLIIAYDNCNIDILLDDKITNISDIKRKEINGIKQINNIYFKENLAYISCSFGLVVLDLIRNEVKDTYKIGYSGNYKEINQTAIINDLIYVATSEGIYYAEKENLFLSDFNQWTQDTSFNNSNFINNSFSSINNLNNTPVAIIPSESASVLISSSETKDPIIPDICKSPTVVAPTVICLYPSTIAVALEVWPVIFLLTNLSILVAELILIFNDLSCCQLPSDTLKTFVLG